MLMKKMTARYPSLHAILVKKKYNDNDPLSYGLPAFLKKNKSPEQGMILK